MALPKTYFFLFVFLPAVFFPQNQNAKWCFGGDAGLDFMSNPPAVFGSTLQGAWGTSSIADAAGNLQLYTEGKFIYNKQFQSIFSFASLMGGAQGVLIVKQPGANPFYYVFSLSVTGLRYTIVDISLNGGLGAVTVAEALVTGTGQAPKITATPHCNGTDLWIVSQDSKTNVTRAYLLTPAGLNTTAVLSAVGAPLTMDQGYLKFSPAGDKLAVTDFSTAVQIFDFNITTGVASNPVLISYASNYAWGIEFSPDGSKLYATQWGYPALWQWDLCANPPAIVQVNSAGQSKGALELAPDGKIYIGRYGQSALGVINTPNAAGPACNFVEAGQSVAPYTSAWHLPNQVKRRPAAVISAKADPPPNCSSVSFSTAGAWGGVIGCTTHTAVNSWNFGDPASGSANTSNLSQVTHDFSGPGTYTVKLVLSYFCGTDTIAHVVNISPSPTLAVSGNLNLCEGSSTTLTASGSTGGYTWTSSNGTQAGSVVVVTPPGAGIAVYTVTGIGSNGCKGSSTASLNVLPKPLLTVSGTTIICQGSTATLSASGALSYTWTGGSTDHSISIPSSNAGYLLSGTGPNGCVATITVNTTSQLPPAVSVNNVTTCVGNPVLLTAFANPAPNVSYSWLPGWQSGNMITVSPSSTSVYSVIASINGCASTATNLVTVKPLTPAVTAFFYNAPICEGPVYAQPQLTANFNEGGNFFSSEGIHMDIYEGAIDPGGSVPGTYVVTYTVGQKGCTAAGIHTTEVTILSSPVLTISPSVKIAPGESATLSVSGGQVYQWSPAKDLSCSDCQNPVASPAENQVYCVSGKEGVCSASACVSVEISCDLGFDFSAPNAFTPDGNGTNDAFCLQGWSTCIRSFELTVFNRWGENVFRTHNPDFCWDGTYKGKLLDADVFVYQVKATYRDAKVVSKRGNIHLIR